ncbi:MAG: hypothetical protein ACR2QH_00190 [Geminicoccaceae bacterium]
MASLIRDAVATSVSLIDRQVETFDDLSRRLPLKKNETRIARLS